MIPDSRDLFRILFENSLNFNLLLGWRQFEFP